MSAEDLARLLVELLMPALLAVAGWALALLRRWAINATVLRAVARGAGAAYLSMVQEKAGASEGAVNRAVLAGADYVEQRIPDTLARAGVTALALQQIVRAELGRMLAADPSVKVGGG